MWNLRTRPPTLATRNVPPSELARFQPAPCGRHNDAMFYSRFKGTTAAVNCFIGTCTCTIATIPCFLAVNCRPPPRNSYC